MKLDKYKNGGNSSDDEELEGAIPNAVFNVSKKKKVIFSQGNLQFRAMGEHDTLEGKAKGVWRFAECQYEVIGEKNRYVAADYKSWIDLFSWGTSGWQGREPWLTPQVKKDADDLYLWRRRDRDENKNKDFFLDGNAGYDMTDCENGDWGMFNAIANGGDEPGLWRTLTSKEWAYLFKNYCWTLAKVEDVLCFLLFPEDFEEPFPIEYLSEEANGTSWDIDISPEDDSACRCPCYDDECPDEYDYDEDCPYDYEDCPYAEEEDDYDDDEDEEDPYEIPNEFDADEFEALEELGVVALPCGGLREIHSVGILDREQCLMVSGVESQGNYWAASADGDNAGVLHFEQNYYSAKVDSNSRDERHKAFSVRLVQDIK